MGITRVSYKLVLAFRTSLYSPFAKALCSLYVLAYVWSPVAKACARLFCFVFVFCKAHAYSLFTQAPARLSYKFRLAFRTSLCLSLSTGSLVVRYIVVPVFKVHAIVVCIPVEEKALQFVWVVVHGATRGVGHTSGLASRQRYRIQGIQVASALNLLLRVFQEVRPQVALCTSCK